MNYEEEINKLNARLDNLQQAYLQSQINQVPITAKTDDTANRVVTVADENVEQSEEITGLGDAIIEMSEIIYA